MSQDKSPPPINPATNEDKNARLWPGTNEDWPREIEVRSLGMLWWATVQPQIPQLRVNQTDPRPCVWFHYVSLVDLVDATSDSPDNSGYQVKLLAALVPWEVPFQLLFWSKDSLFSENHTIHDTKCLVGGSSNWQQLGYFGSQLRSSWVIQICLKLCVAGHLNDSDPYNGWKIGIPILAPDWNIMEYHGMSPCCQIRLPSIWSLTWPRSHISTNTISTKSDHLLARSIFPVNCPNINLEHLSDLNHIINESPNLNPTNCSRISLVIQSMYIWKSC